MTDVTELAESIRAYLRLYVLPANVRTYLHPEDDHVSVAARCAPLLAEWLAEQDSLSPKN